jgi:uncharacterized protein YbjT (DUF2867 family)
LACNGIPVQERAMPDNSSRLILVTGATGQQGGATLLQLREKGFPVRALTRNPDSPGARALAGEGIEVVGGDLDDPESLGRAVDGVYGVYSVQTSIVISFEDEVRQGLNVLEAAQRAGVSHLVYSSVASADRNTGIPHFDSKGRIEEHIRQSGVPYTIIRPVFFMENWLRAKEGIDQGMLVQPLKPETRLSMIAVHDIGAFAALAFALPEHWHNRAVDIAGDDLPMSGIAEAFERAVGRDISYVQLPWEQFEQRTGHEITVMYKWFEEAGYNVDIEALREEYPPLMNFERWLDENWPKA